MSQIPGSVLWVVFFLQIVGASCSCAHEEKPPPHPAEREAASARRSGVPRAPYGSQVITVEATRYWTNTGLYLRAGEKVRLSASGLWTMWSQKVAPHGPAGRGGKLYRGCPWGSLVAKVGLSRRGAVQFVGDAAELVADRDGILFLAPNDGRLEDNQGRVRVAVASEGQRAPVIAASEIGAYDLSGVQAGWIELTSDHLRLVLPKEVVVLQQREAAGALATMDSWYGHAKELTGSTPYLGQRLRYVPDPGIRGTAWMVSGNPIRVDPRALRGGAGDTNLLRVHHAARPVWGFVHEMGHDFIDINWGLYVIGKGPREAWANLVTLYTLKSTRRAERAKKTSKYRRAATRYLREGEYAELRKDPWIALGMLMEFQKRYGWGFYRRFFRYYNRLDLDVAGVPDASADDVVRWSWLRDAFDEIAGQPTSAVFRRYRIPITAAHR